VIKQLLATSSLSSPGPDTATLTPSLVK
jgi:hypothetical protein